MDNVIFSEQASALRDFFASVDAEDLRTASAGISRHFNLPMTGETDWREVEYDFNRLFVGPAAIPAPPYASAYAEKPQLMGKATLEVREAYRALGLEVPDMNATPDDHLAFELDAVTALGCEKDADEAVERLKAWFIGEHMNGWIPCFAAAVQEQSGVSEPVMLAVEALTRWLKSAQAEAGLIKS
ncbi:cytoplasmic chaperone TorD family protein [Pseudodesulfovibrio cashew]|uniref:Cytoplasmic chaperone TorD family protein n=1 Tax=Pseudodesulfovibrio cashew TaxID=2678688 RepID=A0A6I6JJH4_9BACT|nr:molecular chaperone TorD family protein [Pseudodesulfovibrio cashew]QGY40462.1 cytoplasmic chaperone TorD family protein [Pseudodesulfovibrio cashew]